MRKIKKYMLMFVFMFLFIINVNAADFYCKIGKYDVGYNSDGTVVSLAYDGQTINKKLESDFQPKKSSECPDSKNVNIYMIDGGRTYYISKTADFIEEEKIPHQNLGSCKGYTDEHSCQHNDYYSCVWNKTEYGDYCNTDNLQYVLCGDAFDIPPAVPRIVSFLVNLLKIATPIILIVISIISLLKAMSASNEDEMKKVKKSLITKIIAAVMVFFVISIVQFVIMKVADSGEKHELSSCLSCLLNNKCGNNTYYKTNVDGKYVCTGINGGEFDCKESQTN